MVESSPFLRECSGFGNEPRNCQGSVLVADKPFPHLGASFFADPTTDFGFPASLSKASQQTGDESEPHPFGQSYPFPRHLKDLGLPKRRPQGRPQGAYERLAKDERLLGWANQQAALGPSERPKAAGNHRKTEDPEGPSTS